MPIDYNNYPENWKREIVPQVMTRARCCCENCGLENYAKINSVILHGMKKRLWLDDSAVKRHKEMINHELTKVVKVVLTVAHLDHDELNHDVKLSRLRAWCQKCHLAYDAEEKIKRRENKINGEDQLVIDGL